MSFKNWAFFACVFLLGIIIAVSVPTKPSPQESNVVEEPAEEVVVGEIGTGISVVAPEILQTYLESKDSPLAPHAELLLEQEHWKLLVAISGIESQFCTRKIAFNCWGIGGDSAYKHYNSYEEAIVDANNLITKWQAKGKWLTVEEMNCSYVVPCNENWVRVTNKILLEIEGL